MRRSAAVSIRDVAKAAKVSAATVSRTLSNPGVVTESTRRRVLAAVQSSGYIGNPMARGLRCHKTNAVLVLVSDFANPFFPQVIKGIESTAHALGYRILLGNTQRNATRERSYTQLAEQHQVDGIILLGTRSPSNGGNDVGRFPLVIGCEPYPSLPTVVIDNAAAAAEACMYLLALGHRRIGYINGPRRSSLCKDRLAGYRSALRAGGIRYESALVINGDFTAGAGATGLNQLLQRGAPPTAVCCASDEIAIGAIRAAKQHGLKVPEELSVVGFDDIAFAEYCDPPLTTVRQPRTEIGQQLMQLMYREIEGKTPHRDRSVVLPHQLILRGSTLPPRRG